MKKIFVFISIILALLLTFPFDSFSKGGGKGGSRGGTYIGGSGKSRKGSHYYNPSTGNHYQKGSSTYQRRGKTSHSGLGGVSGKTSYKSSIKYSQEFSYHGTVSRDSDGRIVRSQSAKESFLRIQGLKECPNGYQVDHITPLYAGGSDTPSNMQLLSTAEHRAKTKADYQRYAR